MDDLGLQPTQDLGLAQTYDQPFEPLTGGNSGAVTPDAPQPTAPSGPSGFQKFGLALEAFGAGMQGRTPLAVKMQEMDLQQRRQNLLDMENRLQIVDSVSKQVSALPADQQDPYLKSVMGQNADPQLNNMLKFTKGRPDVLGSMSKSVREDPHVRSLVATGKFWQAMEKPEFREYLEEKGFPDHAKEWSTKLPQWQDWARKNKPNEYSRIMKDGKVTIAEINEFTDWMPDNLKPDKNSASYFNSTKGQTKLSGILGMPVVTDNLAEKQAEAEMSSVDSVKPQYIGDGKWQDYRMSKGGEIKPWGKPYSQKEKSSESGEPKWAQARGALNSSFNYSEQYGMKDPQQLPAYNRALELASKYMKEGQDPLSAASKASTEAQTWHRKIVSTIKAEKKKGKTTDDLKAMLEEAGLDPSMYLK